MVTNSLLSQIRLIVSDIDGTLVRKEKTLSDDILREIWALRQRGVLFTVATGRLPYETEPLLNGLPGDIPYVAANGAIVKDKDSVIWESTYQAAPLRDLVVKYDRLGVSVFFSVDDLERPYSMTSWVKNNITMFPGLDQVAGPDIWHRNIHRMFFFHPEGRYLQECYEECKAFEEQYDFCFQDAHSIQIAPPQCTKATGVQRIAERFRLPENAIMCIGDSGNDISMLQYAGIGVAVSNASEALKSAADMITKAPATCGVLETLRLLANVTQNTVDF